MFIKKNYVFEGIDYFPDVYSLKLKEFQCCESFRELVKPKASIARRVPTTIKKKLKLKLEELVKKEIIIPMDEPNKWVNNLVVVQKTSFVSRSMFRSKRSEHRVSKRTI